MHVLSVSYVPTIQNGMALKSGYSLGEPNAIL